MNSARSLRFLKPRTLAAIISFSAIGAVWLSDLPQKRHLNTSFTVLSIIKDYKLSALEDNAFSKETHLKGAKKLLALFLGNGGVYIKVHLINLY